jgi:hypothetical protein
MQTCKAWPYMNPVTLIWSWRKLLPDLEEYDLQGFPNEKISKYEILDMACAMRSSENVDKDNKENWAFSTWKTEILVTMLWNKREKRRMERMTVKEDKVESASVMAWHKWLYSCKKNLYCCEEESKQFTKTSNHYALFLKINISYVEKYKAICDFCKYTKQNILDYPRFSSNRAFAPLH